MTETNVILSLPTSFLDHAKRSAAMVGISCEEYLCSVLITSASLATDSDSLSFDYSTGMYEMNGFERIYSTDKVRALYIGHQLCLTDVVLDFSKLVSPSEETIVIENTFKSFNGTPFAYMHFMTQIQNPVRDRTGRIMEYHIDIIDKTDTNSRMGCLMVNLNTGIILLVSYTSNFVGVTISCKKDN